ncbi:MAG: hypothetical protein MJ225_00185 [Bacilli bacterium]|nr:hypothetical protein [Bacilli bacterium]
MRRLWANVLIAGASMLAVIAAVPNAIKNTNGNGDFTTNHTFTFQLSEKEVNVEQGEEAKPLTDTSAKEMASIMEERLVNSKVSSYRISTSGNDLVTVSFKTDKDNYEQITSYLSFSGSFALINEQNDVVEGKDFLTDEAYKKNISVNEFPTVYIPVVVTSEEYTQVITQARENPTEGEETSTANVYLIYNYVKGDTYKTLSESNKLESKKLLTLDAMTDETLYVDGKVENGKAMFKQECGYMDENGNGTPDANEVRNAFNRADFLINLFHASALDYDVKLIKGGLENTFIREDARVELVMAGGKIKLNATLISCIAAAIIVALLLVVFYRLGALNIMAVGVVTSLLTFILITAIGIEYEILSIVAYVLVASVPLISGIIYCNKLKEETYKGRSIKKANAEASKRSLLPILDVHFVSLVIGIMLFLLGGTAVHSFASILTLGTLISAILSTLGLKGLMWLSTNTTRLTGKYEAFGIDSKNVPDHMAEEKQKFYGPYADKDFTKKKKTVSIIGLVCSVAAIVGVIVGASLKGGNLFKEPGETSGGAQIVYVNEIRVVDAEVDKAPFDQTTLKEDLLDDIVFYSIKEAKPTEEEEIAKHLLVNEIKEINLFSLSESRYDQTEEKSNNYLTTYYEITLNENSVLTKNAGDQFYAYVIGESVPDETTLPDVLDIYFSEFHSSIKGGEEGNKIALKAIVNIPNKNSVAFGKLVLGSFIAMLVITLYMLLRYKLSRGLAMLAYPLAGSSIALGVFEIINICGVKIPSTLAILIPVVTLLSFVLTLLISNREKELLGDEKVKDNSLSHREEVGKKAVALALAPIVTILVIVIYLLINFFGFGPSANALPFLGSILAALIASGLIVVTYMPLANLLFKWFSKVHIERKPRKNKKAKVVKQKSAEPEEAIFIGIND